jgi:adenylate cyclase
MGGGPSLRDSVPDVVSVDELSVSQLAGRAGVLPEDVERLVQLGILVPGEGGRPFTSGDVRRVRLASACAEAGLPLEGIGAAMAAGKLTLAFLDHPLFRWSGRTAETYRDLAARLGMPIALLQRAYEAAGFAPPEPDELVREDDLDLLPTIQAAVAAGIDEDATVRALRVFGDSLRRIAETQNHLFHSRIELPLLRSGLSQRQMIETALQLGSQMAARDDQWLLALYRRQQERAWIADLVEHMEAAIEEAGIHRRVEQPPAMCFLDLVGYTRLTEERGDDAAADIAANLAELTQRAARARGGLPVKWLGDGVMFYFKRPGAAVLSALEMVQEAPAAGLPPAHVGIHAGPIVVQDGDYFGRTVNLAARIAGHAGAGQVLVTDEVIAAAESDSVRYEALGPVRLKGFTRPVRLHLALPAVT